MTEPTEQRSLDGIVLRLHDSFTEVMTILIRVESRLQELSMQHQNIVAKLDTHITDEEAELRAIKDSIKSNVEDLERRLMQGFPNRDPIKHHDYHVELIEDAKKNKQRRFEIVTDTMKKGSWAIILVILAALYAYLKADLNDNKQVPAGSVVGTPK